MCVVLTSSQSGGESVREHGGKMVLAKIKEHFCQRNVQACPVFLTLCIYGRMLSNHSPAPFVIKGIVHPKNKI